MNIKKLIILLTPPIIIELYHRLKPNHIWEGIYTRFEEVKVDGDGLDGDRWAEIVEKETKEIADSLKTCKSELPFVTGDDSLLPLLVSVLSSKGNKIKILDFGGGAGVDYLYVRKAVNSSVPVEFHVVESEKICRRGRMIHNADQNISFHESLPDTASCFDIVHLDSVLQYIEDYKSLLKQLCNYRPVFVLFVRLSSGYIPTYVTRQVNVPGAMCPYQFINFDDLIVTMSDNGYNLAFKGAGDLEYNQYNFPVEYRMNHTCNLLFALRHDEHKETTA